jgi:hypothetical protein
MVAQSDERLAEYFGKNSLGGFGGYDQAAGLPAGPEVSPIAHSQRADNGALSIPIVTYDENLLIMAEASLLQPGGGVTAAATFLNRARANHHKAPISSPTLQDIMYEKYIATFENPEAWNDYKRTCLPAIRPANSRSAVPGRLYTPDAEVQTNPNAPDDSGQNLFVMRNANDPNACR